MDHTLRGDALRLTIDGTLFNETVVTKALYWLSADYCLDVRKSQQEYVVQLQKKPGPIADDEVSEIVSKVRQLLIDFKLRDIVNTETKTIRELLVAKAFAYGDLIETDHGNVSDPVGFNPDNL